MRRGRFIWAVTLVSQLGFAHAASAESLADALVGAYNSSGLLDQNRALLRAADEDVALSVAATRPIINWALEATRTTPNFSSDDVIDTSAAITASLILYDGGANKISVEAQKEVVLSTRQVLRGIEQDVLLRAIQAYMNVVSSREFVALRQSNVRVITQELRAAEDRFEVGEVTRTDVALSEARLAEARSLLTTAQGDLAQAEEEYIAAVGRAPGALDTASSAPVSRDVDDAKAFAVRNHPDVLEIQHNVTNSELNIRRAEAALKPTISLDGTVAVDDEFEDTRQLGITASGPIYQGGALTAQVRQIMAQRDAARALLHETSDAIIQEVGNAYAILQVSQASRNSTNEQIRAARVAFDGVREEARLGARTTLEVLNAEQELLDAQANLISAQAQEVIASYTVLSSMGLLTADHLNLPVQQYDPAEYYNLVKTAPTSSSEQGQALDRVLQAIGQ